MSTRPNPSQGQDRSHERIVKALELFIRQSARPGGHGAGAFLIVGTLGATLREHLDATCREMGARLEWQAAGTLPTEAQTAMFDGLVLLGLGKEAMDLPGRWQPVLQREGLLLLEVVEGGPLRLWKARLGGCGYFRVMDSESAASPSAHSTGSGLLMARSDGRARMALLPAKVERVIPQVEAAQPQKAAPSSYEKVAAIRAVLERSLMKLLQLSAGDLDPTQPFTEYGLESIMGVAFINELNGVFGLALKPTVLFDYATVESLSNHLSKLVQADDLPGVIDFVPPKQIPAVTVSIEATPVPERERSTAAENDIAIIGIAGRFPGAEDVEAFWRDLAAGVHRIGEVPPGRWSGGREHQGGFMADVDRFDPLFFQISGREAEATDPQHRLFLETCYHALEDAGYAGASTALAARCGVFAGVEPGDYLHLLMKMEKEEKSPVFQGNAESILAARIAYFLDLKGPALAINTACSSSLVAIHLACRSLLGGECDLALAGGVRVYASQQAYYALGNMGMLSPEARCNTFDESANGFVPGEAVGVLVLKPLEKARRDGDHIWGVIKGSAINQDGRTNGITAPSSLSQTEVETAVYRNFDLNPSTFQYVEAHGTGTRLGDPIEIEALTNAFRTFTDERQFCAIGSVKTNIGHTMAAAGVVSVIKVLLALKYRQLPPSLHLHQLNPYIDFENSPFRVQTSLTPWETPVAGLRRAAVSSFGFSGTNSHLVIEEAPSDAAPRAETGKPARLILLSAKTDEALQQQLARLCHWLEEHGSACSLDDLAFTLAVGRGHFEVRCAVMATSVAHLLETLKRMEASGSQPSHVWFSAPGAGSAKPQEAEAALHRQLLATLMQELSGALAPELYREKLAALGALYARGYALDPMALYQGETLRRHSLPGYPFARERYWVPLEAEVHSWHPMFPRPVEGGGALHAIFGEKEWFLKEHRIANLPTLPGVAYLEMAAALIASESGERDKTGWRLKAVDWLRPLTVTASDLAVTIAVHEGGRFEVTGPVSETGERGLHARGTIENDVPFHATRRDLSAIKARCTSGDRVRFLNGGAIYEQCAQSGLQLGERFQTIRELWCSADEGLAFLSLPGSASAEAAQWFLHPGLMDGGVQAGALMAGSGEGLPVPFALGEVRFAGKRGTLGNGCYAHIRRETASKGAGIHHFEVAWLDETGMEQVVMHGMTMRERVAKPLPEVSIAETEEVMVDDTKESDVKAALRLYLVEAFAQLVKLPPERIIPTRALEHYGIDSLMIVEFTTHLERDFGPLSRTLLFEHQTLEELCDYFLEDHAERLPDILSLSEKATVVSAPEPVSAPIAQSSAMPTASSGPERDDIAIIGLFGRYPMADDLESFWENLKAGKDAITEIPGERWDYRLFYDPEPGKPGKTRNRWGGFLNGMERFDPTFFGITPREAMALDPQERLFLETAWSTVEDAGYRRAALAGRRIGVYVGVMYGEYQLYGAGDATTGEVYPLSSSYASIANRVSYFFNWHGPSLALDTMCSSSLMAIHLACQSLRLGETEMALAGGVNVTVHPHKDSLLAPGGFASSDGRCHSFGAGGDGYVPGEGVGAVLLKPLSRALADGDVIHGVIKATSVNHGGKTNGYTVPNPKAQTALIRDALEAAGPGAIQYIEAHGTGTPLGDPIEIAALHRALEGAAGGAGVEPCRVGSVKSNIGHLESAAGMAGLSKVLLQMKHGEIVPSLHSSQLNGSIPFEKTPFRVPQVVEPWLRPGEREGVSSPRRAGLSSFGAGGANAHLIVEEPPIRPGLAEGSGEPVLLVLSARKEDRLLARARQLLAFLEGMKEGRHEGVTLDAVAKTLQAGREALAERLAWVAASLEEAISGLSRFLAGETTIGSLYRGRADHDAPLQTVSAKASPDEVARFWVEGGEVDWESRFAQKPWRRVSLPTHPFAGERYWAPEHLFAKKGENPAQVAPAIPVTPEETSVPFYLRPYWAPASLGSEALVPPSGFEGRLLLFDESTALEAEIRERHPALAIVRIVPGASFREAQGVVEINPRSEDDYARLVAGNLPQWVIHRWAETRGGAVLEDALGAGVYSMARLSQALIRRGIKTPVALLFSHRGEPVFAAAGGLAKTVAYEHPGLQWRVLETPRFTVNDLGELLTPMEEREVRYGGDRVRHIRRLAEMAQEPIVTAQPLRPGGVYLMTGGMGGLGRALARHLAMRCGARLALVGRSPLNDAMRLEIAEFERFGAQVGYFQGDIATQAGELVGAIRARFGAIHGVIHAAGVLRDRFLLKKTMADFDEVLAPKVAGTLALDEATRDEPLDWFLLFSSTAGIFGNAAQADYAVANAFLDAFAGQRDAWRTAGKRQGRTLAVNWPYWAAGGMNLSEREVAARLGSVGMAPLPTEAGLAMLETMLSWGATQVVPLWGDRDKLSKTFLSVAAPKPVEPAGRDFTPEVLGYFTALLSEITQLPLDSIDPRERFEAFGVDSIVVSEFNLRLEKEFGVLPKTLFFEYPTLRDLSAHVAQSYEALCAARFGSKETPEIPKDEKVQEEEAAHPSPAPRATLNPAAGEGEIAIIGLAGRYPKAPDLAAFWELLRSGGDAVTRVPAERWDADAFYDADPLKATEGRIYCRWGAFLEEIDRFDPLFFRIAPLEAELIDPQERLMLEIAWQTLEDAGYTRHDLQRWRRGEYRSNVGVFIGATTWTYDAVAQEERLRLPTSLPWSLANRLSYFFNFNGPSMPVDTACSSSLTAIHLACEALRSGACQQALAGGVNLYLHPSKYRNLCMARMLAADGKCRAFGDGGSGFVPGEGVGAVLLKPLHLAVADGDRIYGVIKGTAINHGGFTNGYTVPNPAAQAELVTQALEAGGVDPATISYLEAHGTGTALGDPIEVAGLAKVFGKREGGEPCLLGSVKSNIGHLEAAAGIAGLTKVLLQMRYREVAPTLHCQTVNPAIAWEEAPLALAQRLTPWRPAVVDGKQTPLRAGISSFGAGGANAHLVVEAYQEPIVAIQTDGPQLMLLSARNRDALAGIAARLATYLEAAPADETPLDAIARTLQIGREALEERVAWIAENRGDLIGQLRLLADEGEGTPAFCLGRARLRRLEPTGDRELVKFGLPGEWERVGRLWLEGREMAWDGAWQRATPRTLSLPGYPFAGGRCWVPKEEAMTQASVAAPEAASLREIDPQHPVLRDHQVHGTPILPGAAILDLARQALGGFLGAGGAVGLRQVVWQRPVAAKGAEPVALRWQIEKSASGGATFELQDARTGEVYAQGRADRGGVLEPERLDLPALQARCGQSLSREVLYGQFAAGGMVYGPGFQVVKRLVFGDESFYGELEVSADAWPGFELHPALLDGALQCLATIGAGKGSLAIPFTLEGLTAGGIRPPRRCIAIGQRVGNRYDLALATPEGEVLVRLKGVTVRHYAAPSMPSSEPVPDGIGVVRARTLWVPEALPVGSTGSRFTGTLLWIDDSADRADHVRDLESRGVRVIAVEGEANLRALDWSTLKVDAMVHYLAKRNASPAEAVERGIASLHRVVRSLLQPGRAPHPRLLFCYPWGGPVQSIYEGVGGYARTLRQEEPGCVLSTIGYDQWEPDWLLAELAPQAEHSPEVEIRWLAGERAIRRLATGEPTAAVCDAETFRTGGVYLVSGGMGGLGYLLARYLHERYQAKLVLVGRSALDEEGARRLDELGGATVYWKADISREADARRVVGQTRERFGALHGVIHAAGVLRDGWVRHQRDEDLAAVIAPKVLGWMALEAATRHLPLETVVLFGSTAAVFGNVGQGGYAYANAFLDAWACQPSAATEGKGNGVGPRVLTIDWPLWKEGGMRAGEEATALQKRKLGLHPLATQAGWEVMERLLAGDEKQGVVLYGEMARIEEWLATLSAVKEAISANLAEEPKRSETVVAIQQREGCLKLLEWIKAAVAKVLRLDVEVLEADAEMSEYGFDSITLTTLANELNATHGLELTPAVFFGYPTLGALAAFFWEEHRALFFPATVAPAPEAEMEPIAEVPTPVAPVIGQVAEAPAPRMENGPEGRREPVAVIGMSGIFPGSPDLETFWRHIEAGDDLITRAAGPRLESWQAVGGGGEAPWGGFMDDIDRFDAAFFDISPREAVLMDPQQRLFLQTIWRTLEDAGYGRSALAGTKTGLFVGVAANDYANLLAMSGVPIEAYSATGNAHSVLANRVSYYFDLRGPSEAIDTACSSSLVAIHRALEAMETGSCEMALVGGVNVLLGMGAFEAFGKAGMLCEDGRCKTFDAAANGYVRGEGVGALLLKPLSKAQRDGDLIHGIILGSAENHGGHVQSLTVPNPNAQADLLRDAYRRAGVDTRTVTLLEAHGTGTPLGDPIEINGLKKAWSHGAGGGGDAVRPRCAVGSVKTNIGHLETAAGVAGVIKALLAMRHRTIPGNVHLKEVNPYIQVEGTPFYFPTVSEPWVPVGETPLRAGVSSFGFGGSNAHVVLEEAPRTPAVAVFGTPPTQRPELIVLSARDGERLKESARLLAAHCQRIRELAGSGPTLGQVAYTLMVGREPMADRLAVVVNDLAALEHELARFAAGEKSACLSGRVGDDRAALALLREVYDEGDDRFLEPLVNGRALAKLACLWLAGVEVPWRRLYPGAPLRRVDLPGYPFAKTRHWVPAPKVGALSNGTAVNGTGERWLHPLLQENTSTLAGLRFSSRFSGKETVFSDHRVVFEEKELCGVLPGAAVLEMALAAFSLAGIGEADVSGLRLNDIVWLRPVLANTGKLHLVLNPEGDGTQEAGWAFALQDEEGQLHARGRAQVDPSEKGMGRQSERVDLAAIRGRCLHPVAPESLYAGFEARGLHYGPAFRAIVEMNRGEGEACALLERPAGWAEGYHLHPALLDGALQCLALLHQGGGGEAVELPFALERLDVLGTLPARCHVWVKAVEISPTIRRHDLRLVTLEGEVVVALSGYATRRSGPLAKSPSPVPEKTVPVGAPAMVAGESGAIAYLVKAFAQLTGMDAGTIKPGESLERYGFDSIMAVEFSEQLESDFGSLPKTLLFEYPTLEALATFLEERHAARLVELMPTEITPPASPVPASSPDASKAKPAPWPVAAVIQAPITEPAPANRDEAIAIIGMDGRFPQAETLDAFWENLVSGKDCIETIPGERWDYRLYYDPEGKRPGSSTNQWGGFLKEVDRFDPLFFQISPREAEMLDPQERLFLQTAWNTVENAGYAPGTLKGRNVGVFVGVMYGQYQLFGAAESERQGEVMTLSSSFASIANRVSYFFDWHGPSTALDAMCSSALLSIHLACESIKRGESELALAGGVNLILHPHKDVGLSQGGFLNREGRCRSFGETKGRGYIPGEGVGAILLKPLSAALRDGDAIHGVIRASVVNHGGRTNGYGFPNPHAQADLIQKGLEQAGIDPTSIGYVEAAATGSALGDPLEVAALDRAFSRLTPAKQFCAIGSVKSNIGHLESASGMAGVAKVLLQMQHRTLVPSIHTGKLNPEIAWEMTPFSVVQHGKPWEPVYDAHGQAIPLRACVNAFGAGGSNAHLVMEAAPESVGRVEDGTEPELILLSARDGAGLERRAEQLLGCLCQAGKEAARPWALRDLAATLAFGREPMAERLALLVSSVEELVAALEAWRKGGRVEALYRGQVDGPTDERARFENNGLHRLDAVARRWVSGGPLPEPPAAWRKVALPGYPFAGERYWFAPVAEAEGAPMPSLKEEQEDEIMAAIRQRLAAILKLSPEKISPKVRLVEYGLDSMTSLVLLDALQRAWELELKPAVLLEHPTLEALSRYLRSMVATIHPVVKKPADTIIPAPAVQLLRPARPLQQVAMAPADYLFAGPDRYAMSLLFFFKGRLDGARLRSAVHEVAQTFFPVNGRLVRHGNEGWVIRECADPVDFQEILCGPAVTLPRRDDTASFAPFADSFAPLELDGKLARFRVYQLEEGTLVGATLSHAIADGYSFYSFLSAWAAAARGEAYAIPEHTRQRLTRLGSRHLAREKERRQRALSPWVFPALKQRKPALTTRMETLFFDAEAELTAAMQGARNGNRDKLTENSVLTALVWKAYANALNVPEQSEMTLAVPIDFRRVVPTLTPAFFGNAVVPALVRLERQQLIERSTPQLAGLISDTIRACDASALTSYQAALLALRRGEGRDGVRRRGLVDPASGLIVTNVARFPLPALDFGSGSFEEEFAPVHYAGTAVMTDAGSGRIKVRLALPETARSSVVS